MTHKELNKWFKQLDSFELGFMFPGEYSEVMESADPSVNINTFIKEVREMWDEMTLEEKQELYNQYKEAL